MILGPTHQPFLSKYSMAIRGCAVRATVYFQVTSRFYRLLLAFVLLLLIVMASLFFYSSIFFSKRSYYIDAEVLHAEFAFAGDRVWEIFDTVLCKEIDISRNTFGHRGGNKFPSDKIACNSSAYTEEKFDIIRLLWKSGSRAEISRDSVSKRMSLRLLTNIADDRGNELPKGAIIKFKYDDTSKYDALAFAGNIVLGSSRIARGDNILLSGTYQAREMDYFGRIAMRERSTVVQEGKIYLGGFVQVVNLDQEEGKSSDINLYGYFAPAVEVNGALRVVVISEASNSAIEIGYPGLSAPVLVRPDWVERAIASPLLLVSTLLISLFANTVAVAIGLFSLVRRRVASEVQSIGQNE